MISLELKICLKHHIVCYGCLQSDFMVVNIFTLRFPKMFVTMNLKDIFCKWSLKYLISTFLVLR